MNGAGVLEVVSALHAIGRPEATASSLERRARRGDWCLQAGGAVEVHLDLGSLVIDPDTSDPVDKLIAWMERVEVESAAVAQRLFGMGFTVAQYVDFVNGRAHRAPCRLIVTGSPARAVALRTLAVPEAGAVVEGRFRRTA